MTEPPFVTVLIPARNEEADIGRCLRAVLDQDYPHDRMEIFLVDGGSTDRTAQVAAEVLASADVRWTVIDNPDGSTPSNLNAGLSDAAGEILCRVDARSLIPPSYVQCCVDVLQSRSEVMVTGGAQTAVAVDDSILTCGIARALNNRYFMGGSRYRSGRPSGPSDTVYLGAFRTGQLRLLGGWNEKMSTNQDYELNRRLAALGIVWFDERLRVEYVPRRTLGALWRQYHRFGRWKVRYWRTTGDRPQSRQWLLLLTPPSALACAALLVALPGDRRRRIRCVSVAGGLALVAVERAGATEPDCGVVASPVAGLAGTVVACGWLSGIAREAVVGDK